MHTLFNPIGSIGKASGQENSRNRISVILIDRWHLQDPGALDRHWKRNTLADGNHRPASLDMGPEFRAMRSLSFVSNNLTDIEIQRIHSWEIKNMWERYIDPWEIRKVLNKPDYRGAKCRDFQLEWLKDYVREHEPDFMLPRIDCDGMLHHHAWDFAIMRAGIMLPSGQPDESSTKTSKYKRGNPDE